MWGGKEDGTYIGPPSAGGGGEGVVVISGYWAGKGPGYCAQSSEPGPSFDIIWEKTCLLTVQLSLDKFYKDLLSLCLRSLAQEFH